MSATKASAPTTPTVKASPEEEEKKRKERYAKLAKCFRMCDLDENGLIDTFELEVAVRSFNPQCTNVDQEVKTVLGKLDKNQDNKIDLNEWSAGLLELFQFMSNDAFDRHCDELLQLIKTNADRVRQQLLTPAGAAGAKKVTGTASAAGGTVAVATGTPAALKPHPPKK